MGVALHQSVQIARPLSGQDRFEEFLLRREVEELVAHEILEYVVGSYRRHISPEEVVVVGAPGVAGEGVIGFIDLHELPLGFLVVGVVLGVVLEGQFPVGLLDLIDTGIFGHSKHIVVSSRLIRVMGIEEFLLVLILHPFFLEEPLKGPMRVFHRVLLLVHLIKVGPLVPVRQDLVGFVDVMELGFGLSPILFVAVRVPVSG